ncbi:acylneuraminate cytidylyltransferase family protein [Planktomarina temperata]|nr:acylneuraminate cytidylyltransferase family protein [Planktomarina temperata]MDB2459779.1 acylneuraminate cytidylyltransferase family protein [Planktomarina temperata]
MISDTLCVIVARGGSKGILNKNLQILGDKPLIDWVLEVSKEVFNIEDIFLSTDSDAIAARGHIHEIDCYPRRPSYLASDTAKVADVIAYTLELVEAKRDKAYRNLLLLQPTSPFVGAQQIKSCLKLLREGIFKTVISAKKAAANHPSYMFSVEKNDLSWIYDNNDVRRQDLKDIYLRVGNFYAFKTDLLRVQPISLYGGKIGFVEVEEHSSLTIDSLHDLRMARCLVNIMEK